MSGPSTAVPCISSLSDDLQTIFQNKGTKMGNSRLECESDCTHKNYILSTRKNEFVWYHVQISNRACSELESSY